METEGYFGFTNGTFIEHNLSEARKESVIDHETVHHILYTETTVGQFVLMMEKNELLFPQAKALKEAIFSHMNRLQERTAVSVETLKIYEKKGYEEYKKAKEDLFAKNRTYYNYLKKMCCINERANTQDEAEEYSQIIIAIAKAALNINLFRIPFEDFETRKDYEKFISIGNNNTCYVPNRRFEIMVNCLFRENDNDNDLESVTRGSIRSELMNDYDYIHNMAIEKAKMVYKKSFMCDSLIKRIETVCAEKYGINDMKYLGALPRDINIKKEYMVFVVASAEKFMNIIKCKEISDVTIMNMRGFEDFYIACIDYSEKNERIKTCICFEHENEFLKFINQLECNIIFDKLRIISKLGNSVKKHVHVLPVYVYIDVPVMGLLNKIEKLYYGAKYSFIEKNGYIVWVICKKSQIFMANVIFNAKDYIKTRFEHLEYVENLSEIVNFEELIRIHDYCVESFIRSIDKVNYKGLIE